MDSEITLPSLGDNVTEAFVVDWLVGVGDAIDVGTPILEVMTDKANVEVESTAAGTLVEQRVRPEERILIDQVVAIIRSG